MMRQCWGRDSLVDSQLLLVAAHCSSRAKGGDRLQWPKPDSTNRNTWRCLCHGTTFIIVCRWSFRSATSERNLFEIIKVNGWDFRTGEKEICSCRNHSTQRISPYARLPWSLNNGTFQMCNSRRTPVRADLLPFCLTYPNITSSSPTTSLFSFSANWNYIDRNSSSCIASKLQFPSG